MSDLGLGPATQDIEHAVGPPGGGLQGHITTLNVVTGRVVNYAPRAGETLVRFLDTNLIFPCTDLLNDYLCALPMGSRPVAAGYLPGTTVLVLRISGLNIILGVLPPVTMDLKAMLPTSIALRSEVGAADPNAPMYISMMKAEEGLHIREAGRPLDGTAADWGRVNELGAGFILGRLMAAMKASDQAKVEAFWGDDLLRLTGHNLQLFTGVREEWEYNDEGEGNLVRRSTPYAWEAIGCLEALTEGVREAKGRARESKDAWWEPQYPDQMILPRHTVFRGYMGDVEHEFVSAPGPNQAAIEQLANRSVYLGLLAMHKGVDGSLSMRSARSITLEKTLLIPVPKELVPPDDPLGDNRKNYRAAGHPKLGTGQEPDLPEFEFPEAQATGAAYAAYFYECQAWLYNRLVPGGLYLHTTEFEGKDWYWPSEEEVLKELGINSAVIAPATINIGNKYLADLPASTTLKIDHRRGEVRYYQSRSAIKMLEDGGILIEDGYGSQVLLQGGSIFLSCVGDVFTRPGRSAITWAPRDIELRAGNCMDLSSAKNDIHIKAEKNIEVLVGNGGKGAFVLDCRSVGDPARDDFIETGEDRETSGIIVKSPQAPVWIFGQRAYLGGANALYLNGGDTGKIYVRSSQILFQPGYRFAIQDTQNTTLFDLKGQELWLSPKVIRVGGNLYLGGYEEGTGHLMVNGRVEVGDHIFAKNSIYSEAGFQAYNSAAVSQVDRAIPFSLESGAKVRDSLNTSKEQLQALMEGLEAAVIDDEDAPGSLSFQERVHFSFRESSQYFGGQEDTFQVWEARWQSILGLDGQDTTWDEPEVTRPIGGAGLPHPGKEVWEGDYFWKPAEPVNYDPATGAAALRKELEPAMPEPVQQSLKDSYLINTQE